MQVSVGGFSYLGLWVCIGLIAHWLALECREWTPPGTLCRAVARAPCAEPKLRTLGTTELRALAQACAGRVSLLEISLGLA